MSLETAVSRFPNFGYQQYFASPESTKEIEINLEMFFASMYQTPTSTHKRDVTKLGELQSYFNARQWGTAKWDTPWNKNMLETEGEYYLDTFASGGMNGPLNWYRTTKLRFDEEKDLPSQLPNLPWLLMYGSKDKTCSKKHCESTKRYAPQIQVVALDGVSHWVMIEAKEAVTKAVIGFVKANVESVGPKL